MSDSSNSSSVSIVAIIAILLLVGLAVWLFFIRGGGSNDAELEIEITSIEMVQPTHDAGLGAVGVPRLEKVGLSA